MVEVAIIKYALIAQWKEQSTSNAKAKGSNPFEGTDRVWYNIPMPYKNREDMYANQKRHRISMRDKVLEYLLEHPCQICGEKDPIVLDFDHIDPSTKYKTISKLLSGHYGWNKIKSEIDKCRVLCANCHRRHTYVQLSHWGKG